jgi:hypothetical protein
MPRYVGKSTKGFYGECFNADKLVRYNDAIAEYKRGTPLMFFIVEPPHGGGVAINKIKEAEEFLIRLSYKRNNRLKQKKKTKFQPDWDIHNVPSKSKGNNTNKIRQFKKMIGIE